jgi:nucleoside 2-deoxyribosyltransferase
MAVVVKPTDNLPDITGQISIFLAGSIEMGNCEDWQSKVQELLKDEDVIIYNPRREGWDSSWEQRASNENFAHQVNWELDRLDDADIIFMYIDPTTKSPITLLELGLFADSDKVIVCCPDGFYRKGNVEIVCKRNYIPLYNEFGEAFDYLKRTIKNSL